MTTHHEVRNRDLGVPGNGGQYAEAMLDVPTRADLPADIVAHNAQGSFYFPPPPKDPTQYIDFWEHVEISDAVLVDFETRYYARIDKQAAPLYRKRVEEYVAKRLAVYDERLADEKETASYKRGWENSDDRVRQQQLDEEARQRRLAEEDFREEAKTEVKRPSHREIPEEEWNYPAVRRSAIRPLARAGAMSVYLPAEGVWSEADREAVLEHKVDLGLGEVITVREAEEKYKVSEIAAYLDAPRD